MSDQSQSAVGSGDLLVVHHRISADAGAEDERTELVALAADAEPVLSLNQANHIVVQMDYTGTTRIGKYVFNHPFFIPGVATIAVAVALAFGLGALIL